MILPLVLASALALPAECLRSTKKLTVEVVTCFHANADRACENNISFGDWILRACPAASDTELAILATGHSHLIYYRMVALVRLYKKGGFRHQDFWAAQMFPNAIILQQIADLEAGRVTAQQLQVRMRTLRDRYSSHVQKIISSGP